MKPNIELLDEIIKYAEENPEHYNQLNYAKFIAPKATKLSEIEPLSCGTAYCIAGLVAALDKRPAYWAGHYSYEDTTMEKGEYNTAISCRTPSGLKISMWSYAQDRLGLDHLSASLLFDASNTLDQIKYYRNILAKRGEIRMKDYENWRKKHPTIK